MHDFLRHTKIFFLQGLKEDFIEKDRIISPLMLAVTMLLLLGIASATWDKEVLEKVYLAHLFLPVLFALQVAFHRIFEGEQKDQVIGVLRSYSIHFSSFFLAKFFLACMYGGLVIFPCIGLGCLLYPFVLMKIEGLYFWLTLGLSLGSLSALGVLLSALTLGASGRSVLFPILYFPLAIPVVLCSLNAMLAFSGENSLEVGCDWLILLGCFFVIFGTLGFLLFGELMKAH